MALQRALDQALVGQCRPHRAGADLPGACAEVGELLALGASPNAVDRETGHVDRVHGRSALSIAAGEGYYPIVKLLVDHKADVNQADPRDGERPLDRCCYKHLGPYDEIVALLLHHGAAYGVDYMRYDRSRENERFPTALHKAAHDRRPETFRMLLERGHDPLARNLHNKTPAQCALDTPQYEALVEVGCSLALGSPIVLY